MLSPAGVTVRGAPPVSSARDAAGDSTPLAPDAESSGGSPAVADERGRDLERLCDQAEADHPRLRAAQERLRGALARAESADALPDPRLAFREYLAEVETRSGPMRRALGLQQALPAAGSRGARRRAALAAADTARARLEAERLALRADVARAHAELYHLGRTIAFVRADVGLLEALERVLRARFGAGGASHTDLARAQVELGRLADRLEDLEERAGPARAARNAAGGRPVSAPLAWPAELSRVRLDEADERVLEQAVAANPDLTALACELERARALERLASTLRRPKTMLGLEAIQIDASDGTDGADAWVVSLGIDLPVRRGVYRAEERAARAAVGAAAGTLEDRRNTVAARAHAALSRLHDAERKLELYAAALIPKAREALEAAQAAFGTGAADLDAVIEAQRTLLEFHLTGERALADHQILLAELESLVGRTLETTPQRP
jgi:outer membrane protein TolC